MGNRTLQLKRILKVNPSIGFTLAELVDQPNEFDDALFEAVGLSKEIRHFEGLTFSEVKSELKKMLGGYQIKDSVHWKASRETNVLRISANGKNYRLWHWTHADNFEMGWEGFLYEEAPELTEAEMAFFE